MPAALERIQGLWVGSRLSEMARLSIQSFLKAGHQYHLYSYSTLDNVPDGTVIKDANAIMPETAVFKNAFYNTYAAFSDRFRYELLYSQGGWWADMDVIALRPWDLTEQFVFASQREADGTETPMGAVIKCPAGAPIMKSLCEQAGSFAPDEIRWGEIGPKLLETVIKRFSYWRFVTPPAMFCPIDYYNWFEAILPGKCLDLIDGPSLAIHLWSENWRRIGAESAEIYGPNCLYEILKLRVSNGMSG
jgi:hypothetical protein